MSGECNVCDQEHAEIKHCPFKQIVDEQEKEIYRLKLALAGARAWNKSIQNSNHFIKLIVDGALEGE